MKQRLMSLLRCPKCSSTNLKLHSTEERFDGEIITGQIICQSCQQVYDINEGVPRMLIRSEKLDDTKRKFEFQWDKWGKDDVIFGRTKDESRQYLMRYAGFELKEEYFKGKRILDAGCGHGRFVEIFSDLGAELSVGIDLGEGIRAAVSRNAGRPNVELVQGNLLEMPFREDTFDYIWCNGVLHHTPNPKGALGNLVTIARPGGFVNLWLYPKGNLAWEISQSAIRAVTTRLPPYLLYLLCYIAVPLLYVVPTYSGTNPRKNTWRQCAQVIYDWYSPRYQSHHTEEEVINWFHEFGVFQTDVLDLPITIIGKKKP